MGCSKCAKREIQAKKTQAFFQYLIWVFYATAFLAVMFISAVDLVALGVNAVGFSEIGLAMFSLPLAFSAILGLILMIAAFDRASENAKRCFKK